MTAKVIEQSGKTVTVATINDITGDISDLPVATTNTTGVVKVGDNLSVASDGTVSVATAAGTTLGVVSIGTGISNANGEISVAAATSSVVGGVIVGSHISNVGTQTFTDIAGAQTSVNTVATQLNALILALTNSGVLASS